jgi:hypothetical protein
MRSASVSVHVSTYVDVDMDEFDTKDLVEELKRRGKGADIPEDAAPVLARLHVALKLGNDADALPLAREYVSRALGVIL